MERYEIVKYYEDFKKRIADIKEVLNLDNLKQIILNNEQMMIDENFWNDASKASDILQQTNELKESLNNYQVLNNNLEEIETILELNDDALFDECNQLINQLNKELEHTEIKLLLNEEYDKLNAIVELHPGAGGTESQDWGLMLYRMYKRYAERNNFEFELLDYQEANDAGIKSVTFMIKGKNAFGILKSEKGVHRLVRISPFDSNARRHTSFVACNITPFITENNNIVINNDDIRIDTYRSSGAGGQHVNTTDSAVRITHLPTGIVVSCQNERSQIQNKERALSILKSKLYQKQKEEQENLIRNIGQPLTENAFGSQIRSYILHPYSLVKDHRTSFESTNPQSVLDGDLEDFINAYLKWYKSKK